MSYTIRKEKDFQFIDEGAGPVLILLHGLFGALSNWVDVVERFKKNYRVVIPLMTGGLLAGFVTSFATAAVELSAVLILVQNNSDAPLSYGLYVLMQSSAGRGPGAALGVIAVVLVAACTLLSHFVIERGRITSQARH